MAHSALILRCRIPSPQRGQGALLNLRSHAGLCGVLSAPREMPSVPHGDSWADCAGVRELSECRALRAATLSINRISVREQKKLCISNRLCRFAFLNIFVCMSQRFELASHITPQCRPLDGLPCNSAHSSSSALGVQKTWNFPATPHGNEDAGRMASALRQRFGARVALVAN